MAIPNRATLFQSNGDDPRQVLDSTKLKCYLECERKYLFQYILGWNINSEPWDRIFGTAWHVAMEHLLLHGKGEESIKDAKEKALVILLAANTVPRPKSVKRPDTLAKAIEEYAAKYESDKAKVLHTEVAGSMAISEGRLFHFKIDAILEDHRGIVCQEHKTGGRPSASWGGKWPLDVQVNIYTIALHMYYGLRAWGVEVNAAFFSSVGERHFLRFPIRRSDELLNSFLLDFELRIQRLDQDMKLLEEATADDPHLLAFPRNPTACSHFFGCDYLPYCRAKSNPLRYGFIPQEFVERHWDPRKRRAEAKALLDISEEGPKLVVKGD